MDVCLFKKDSGVNWQLSQRNELCDLSPVYTWVVNVLTSLLIRKKKKETQICTVLYNWQLIRVSQSSVIAMARVIAPESYNTLSDTQRIQTAPQNRLKTFPVMRSVALDYRDVFDRYMYQQSYEGMSTIFSKFYVGVHKFKVPSSLHRPCIQRSPLRAKGCSTRVHDSCCSLRH